MIFREVGRCIQQIISLFPLVCASRYPWTPMPASFTSYKINRFAVSCFSWKTEREKKGRKTVQLSRRHLLAWEDSVTCRWILSLSAFGQVFNGAGRPFRVCRPFRDRRWTPKKKREHIMGANFKFDIPNFKRHFILWFQT
jgi:hypothetical protein